MGTLQNDVLDKAIRKAGVNQITSEHHNWALDAFNDMVSSLSAEDIIIPYFTRESFTLTVSQSSYTIGSGGDFNTVRPEEITNAYIRDTNGFDNPIDTNMSLGEYKRIRDKDRSRRPNRLVYLREYPLGKIIFDSAPETAEDIYLDSLKQIAEVASITTTLTIPPEYKEFFVFNLAVRLSPDFGTQMNKEVYAIADSSYKRVVNQNFKSLISQVEMDLILRIRNYRGGYDITAG